MAATSSASCWRAAASLIKTSELLSLRVHDTHSCYGSNQRAMSTAHRKGRTCIAAHMSGGDACEQETARRAEDWPHSVEACWSSPVVETTVFWSSSQVPGEVERCSQVQRAMLSCCLIPASVIETDASALPFAAAQAEMSIEQLRAARSRLRGRLCLRAPSPRSLHRVLSLDCYSGLCVRSTHSRELSSSCGRSRLR